MAWLEIITRVFWYHQNQIRAQQSPHFLWWQNTLSNNRFWFHLTKQLPLNLCIHIILSISSSSTYAFLSNQNMFKILHSFVNKQKDKATKHINLSIWTSTIQAFSVFPHFCYSLPFCLSICNLSPSLINGNQKQLKSITSQSFLRH